MSSLSIIIYLYSIATAASALLISHSLYRDYKLKYLNFYFHFLLTCYIGHLLNLIGGEMFYRILRTIVEPTIAVQALFNLFILYPFLLLSLYFAIRMALSWLEKPFSLSFKIGLIAYSLFFTLFHFWGTTQYLSSSNWTIARVTSWLGDTAMIVIYYLILLYMITKSKYISDTKSRQGIRNFALIYVICYLILDVESSKFLAAAIGYPRTSMMIILVFAAHFPPLLYMRSYLKSFFLGFRFSQSDQPVLLQFYQQHNITNREGEVVELLIAGKTRREIHKDLNISVKTVQNHIYNIYKKLAVINKLQMIKKVTDYVGATQKD